MISPKNQYDVLIAGGGPVGLAAGIVFGEGGLKTLLCEKQEFPVEKVCGEGIMPTGVAVLKQLGIGPYLHRADRFPFSGIRYIGKNGQTAEACFEEGPGWGVGRKKLSEALWKKAQTVESLRIRQNTRITGVEKSDDRITIFCTGELLSTRLLVGADGLHSWVRKWFGLNISNRPYHRWGTGQHYRVTPWSPFVEVYWGKGVEAYVTPVGDQEVGIAFLWDKDWFHGGNGGKNLMEPLWREFPALQDKIREAESIGRVRSIGPLYQSASSVIHDRLILIGDAAGFVDAITGEGISIGLEQALSLRKHVLPLVGSGNGGPTRERLKGYEESYREITRRTVRNTRLVLSMRSHPFLLGILMRLCRQEPRLFQILLSSNMGKHFSGIKFLQLALKSIFSLLLQAFTNGPG